jgi:hypothetical protein
VSQPKVDIQIQNGSLGRTAQVTDGVAGLVVTGVAAASLALGVAKRFYSLAEAEAVGINATVSSGALAHAWTQISDFFATAGDGAELWVILIANTTSQATAVALTGDDSSPLEKVIVASNGRVTFVGTSLGRAAGYTPSYSGGFDGGLTAAASAAQSVAAKFFGRYTPVHIVLDGAFMDPALNYTNYRSGGTTNHVSCFVGTDVAGGRVAAMGKLLGRIASNPVQRNVGRVKDGSFMAEGHLTTGLPVVSMAKAALDAIHDAGFILPRIHLGIAGVFLSDDPTLVVSSDDFTSISRNLVIGKAVRLTYQTYVFELLDEIEIQDDGTMSPTKVAYFEERIEQAILQQMVTYGNCSSVNCKINPHQNILSTDQLEIELKIVPVGQLKQIIVKLGFSNPALTAS